MSYKISHPLSANSTGVNISRASNDGAARSGAGGDSAITKETPQRAPGSDAFDRASPPPAPDSVDKTFNAERLARLSRGPLIEALANGHAYGVAKPGGPMVNAWIGSDQNDRGTCRSCFDCKSGGAGS